MNAFRRLLILATLGSLAPGALAGLRPVDLRCEYLKNPLGIDTRKPRLSWRLEAESPEDRSLTQSAYEIVVAGDLATLRTGAGEVWRSGRVFSAASIQVPYAGRDLRSGEYCFWKVRVWDQDGHVSDWSPPARWSMGLLAPADWQGRWIGRDEIETKAVATRGEWIWFPEGDPAATAPVGQRLFRRVFRLPGGTDVKRATLEITADNQFTAFVNGERIGEGGNFKSLARFEIGPHLRPGHNVLAVAATNAGDSPNPAGLLAALEGELGNGETFQVVTDGSWHAASEAAPGWEGPVFDDAAWPLARSLGSPGMAPWGEISRPTDRRLPARYLRREFDLAGPVRRATLHLAGLGLSEAHLNGRRVGDEVLSPGLTDYDRRVFYVTHDVTDRLQPGANALGVTLGSGRYYAPRLREPTATRTYGFPKLLLQLEIELADGSRQTVVSDESWQLTTDGPIRANCEYDGEEYDARLEMPGWSRAGFMDPLADGPSDDGLARKWESAHPVGAPEGALAAPMIEPIRVTEVLRPVAVTEPEPGTYIFDLGQNMVGWCRLRVAGPRGTRVTLRHAETLKPDGTLYLDNIRGALVTDVYTLRGEGLEVYEPRFTYHGFRYVEMRGFPGRPDRTALEGCVVHDDLESAGEWTSSNPLLNRILRNVRWGVRGNYRSIPTDCPQRDERQGWLGDRSEESRGEAYLHDIAALYAKWLQDMDDAQRPDGSVPDVCPPYWPIYSDNVTWPSSTVIIPDHLRLLYADRQVIDRHYPGMRRWMEHMAGFIEDGLLARDSYGDWCVPPEDPHLIHSQDPARKTSPRILASAYYVHCCRLMADYAGMLNRPEDVRHYTERADEMEAAFNTQLYDAGAGYYDNGSQTSCVLPLAFGLAPAGERSRVFGHLLDKLTGESRRHVGTGLIGGQWLMRTLTRNGQADLAYALAANRTYPSWGYMIDQGATTIWELWNGNTADPAMNSGNHVMLVGDLVIWCFEDLAGIRPDPAAPGFKRLVMAPVLAGDLEFVQASHHSPYGWVRSYWRRDGDRFDWRVEVPPNCTARLRVPTVDPAVVTEGGRLAADQPGIRFLGFADRRAGYDLGSGVYRFTTRLAQPDVISSR
ncbi:MAG: family 78 glycoside hydrolase catalytic domain [Verrucomicrobiales bacterium]|nr:family 78 glycoside hydrolase catalytic domain [Verrucomicrobiales bacterium]MCP5527176.1 family 78 glycoside hydrolase catalytic domain [Verrucomicrobiales bacterium]